MYKKMYLKLFNAVTDALEAMEWRNYGQAEDLLKRGQQEAEELYLAGEEAENAGENDH